MIAEYRIFNDLSGRYLATLNDDYLTFISKVHAQDYRKEMNLSPEVFKIVKVWREESDNRTP